MEIQKLKDKLFAWTLFLGVLQITFGCLIGLISPSVVPWFRGIVMAHIEYTANGVLMLVFAFLLKEFNFKERTLWVWFITLQLGTWTNGTAGLVAAVSGSTSSMLPSLNEKFPPPNGTNNLFVSALLLTCAVTLLISLFITLAGLIPKRK